jgi:superkiller protein 3
MLWGVALAVEKNDDDAIRLYRKATAADPSLASPYLLWGTTLWRQGQFAEGLDICLKPVLRDPSDPDRIQEIAAALVDLNDDQAAEASEKLNQTIRNNATRAAIYRLWGDGLILQERYTQAVARYQDALRTDPRLVEALLGLGRALRARKEYDAAIEQYTKASQIQPELASIYIGWAEALTSQEQYEKAAERYEQAIEKDPSAVNFVELLDLQAKLNPKRKEQTLSILDGALAKRADAKCYASWANALAISGSYAEAVAQYDKALALDGKAARTWRRKGEAQVSLYDYAAALRSYRKVTELDPYDSDAYMQCGYALANQGRHTDAIECYKKTLEIEPDSIDGHNAWGWASYFQDNYDAAMEQYNTTIEKEPNSANAHNCLGFVLAAKGMYDDAVACYQKAIDLNPEDWWPHLNCGTLAERGTCAQAIAICKEAPGKFPDLAYAYHNVASLFRAQGDYRSAWAAWQRAAQVYERTRQNRGNRRDPDFFRYYGSMLYENLWNVSRAEQVLEEGRKLNPRHTGILGSLVSLHLDRLDELRQDTGADAERPVTYAKAREYYKTAEGILKEQLRHEESSRPLQELGDLYLKMGEYDQAKDCFEKALRRNPEFSEASVGLGVLYSRQEDFRQAARYFEAARRLDPNDLNVWSNLAEAYLKINSKKVSQIEKAETEFRQILRIAPEHIDSLIGLGEVYTAKAEAGDKDFYNAAIKHYGRAIELWEQRQGSKRLSSKQLAAVHYSQGYARVRLYEASRPFGDESLLSDALQNFDRCAGLDRDHCKAATAKDKLDKLLNRRPLHWIPEKVAPWLVLGPSLFVLILTQVTFVSGFPRQIDTASYVGLTFGSLIFVVVGLFLPEIQKLKGAGIELEKSAVTQISTATSLGITK